MRRFRSCALVLALGLIPAWAPAQVPATISFQGLALDPAGSPIDGTRPIGIRLWNDPVSVAPSSEVYREEHPSVSLIDGVFHLLVGTGTAASRPFDSALFQNPDLWLEIEVAGELLAPRTKLGSVPYAFRCADARTLGGFGADQFLRELEEGTGIMVIPSATGVREISADYTQVQRRVSSGCPAGSSVQQIGADGSVVCEPDDVGIGDITGVVAGAGLTGGGTSGNVALSIAIGGVNTGEILDNSIQSVDIAANTIGTSDIATGGVTGIDVADNSVAAVDLFDEAGAEFASGDQLLILATPATPVVVRSVTLTAPTAGFVIASASADVEPSDAGNFDSVRCSLTTGTVIDAAQTIWVTEPGTGIEHAPIALTRGFAVAAGATAINLVCSLFNGEVAINDSSVSAMFFPTRY